MNRSLRAALIALSIGFATNSAHAQTTFRFQFTSQGWNVYSISFNGQDLPPNPGIVTGVAYDGLNGLPPGSVRIPDAAGETWAGHALSGDMRSVYGVGEISYDAFYRFRDEANYAAVGFVGGGLSLWIATPPPTLNAWEHHTFPLVAGAWRVGTINGPAATEAQMLQALSDLHGFYIHTEWRTGPDDTNLDNVVFGIPDPCPIPCNRADISEIGGSDLAPGCPDQQLTIDDLIVFVNLFSSQQGCPATPPCNLADLAGVGGQTESPDGQLTIDDLIEFVNAFSEGCG